MVKIVGWVATILIIVGLINVFSNDSEPNADYNVSPEIEGVRTSSPSPTQYYPTWNEGDEDDGEYADHDEDVDRYQYLGGSYTVEACNIRTGSCYDLDADIDSGQVERIYFPNGGHLDLDGAELDEDGYAVGESYTVGEGYNGDEWEVSCHDCE